MQTYMWSNRNVEIWNPCKESKKVPKILNMFELLNEIWSRLDLVLFNGRYGMKISKRYAFDI